MKKILIVEDELAYTELLKEQLDHLGYTILTAKDGAEGLEVAQKERPDLIILDIRMPVMDGTTMLDQLRHEDYGEKTKVIMLTNLEPDGSIIKKVVKNQPIYYLIKSDISLDELIEKVKELLQDEVKPLRAVKKAA